MSVVIIGGNECMVCQYQEICKKHGCKAKIFVKEKSGFKKIATVTSTTYIDSKVKGGIKYYYKVVPYKGKAAGKEKIESGIAVTKPVANVKVKNLDFR